MPQPTPGDPTVTNIWGVLENEGRTLVDIATQGQVTLSVAGSADVPLIPLTPYQTQGQPDNSTFAHFILVGALTGNIRVLWPYNQPRCFSVKNSTTGNFTLSIGAQGPTGAWSSGAVVSVPQGETYVLVSDGTNVSIRSSIGGRLINIQQFNTSGTFTYTPTPGAGQIYLRVQGAGAGGGGAGDPSSGDAALGSGGNSGQYAEGWITDSTTFNPTVSVTIGAKGAGGDVTGSDGSDGGATSFGALIICTGGKGGNGSAGATPPFVTQSKPDVTMPTFGGSVTPVVQGQSSAGGYALAFASATVGTSGDGGLAPYGGAVKGRAATNAGTNAVSPGCGGSGAASFDGSGTGEVAGDGQDGYIVVFEYAA